MSGALGTFRLRSRRARKAGNPKPRTLFEVAPKRVPFFKPGKEIKSLLAGTVTRRLFGDERRKSAAADLASLRHFGAGFEKNPEKRIRKEDVRRLSEQLMPLFDRANRMAIRNLKAIKELRQGLVPAIAIGRAEHVTVTRPQNGRGIRPVNPTLPAVKM